jgi:hypothetical protein
MAPSDAFDPPATIAECEAAKFAFGHARAEVGRVSFETGSDGTARDPDQGRTFSELDQEQALAGFDQAAWAGDEKASPRQAEQARLQVDEAFPEILRGWRG